MSEAISGLLYFIAFIAAMFLLWTVFRVISTAIFISFYKVKKMWSEKEKEEKDAN